MLNKKLAAAVAALRAIGGNPTRVLLAAALVFVAWQFYALLGFQEKTVGAGYLRETLVKKGDVLPLSDWRVIFYDCSKRPCKSVGDSYDITFPASEKLREILESLPSRPDIARIEHTLTDEERAWAAKRANVILVFPAWMHRFTVNLSSIQQTSLRGYLDNISFSYRGADIRASKFLRYDVNINKLRTFGSREIPPALTSESAAAKYSSIYDRILLSGMMGTQLQIGIPVLLIGIALILDHSALFALLALFALAHATRQFVALDFEAMEPLFSLKTRIWAYLLANALLAFAQLRYCLVFAEIKVKRWVFPASFLVIVAAIGIAHKTSETFLWSADRWTDFLTNAVAAIIALYGIRLYMRHKEEPGNAIEKEARESTTMSRAIYWARFALAISIFFIASWVNGMDVLSLGQSELRDSLNWAHLALLPTLIVVSLMEIGSTSKKMRVFGQVMVAKALIDRDMQVGKEIQETLLPVRRGNNSRWAWRAFYYPAVSLAGDWFDIRMIRFADGKEYLLCCLADVTGHGIGAALMTSTISSHWNIWCENIEKNKAPASDAEREELLVQGPATIHRGLTALKRNSGCTAGFMLFDMDEGKMTYTLGGHPGILTFDSKERAMGFHFNSGARLGFEGTTMGWEAATVALKPGESVHLFSDGIAPPGEPVAKWLKSVQRTQRKSDRSLSFNLLSGIRINRKRFRKDRSSEDDMSLIIVTHIG